MGAICNDLFFMYTLINGCCLPMIGYNVGQVVDVKISQVVVSKLSSPVPQLHSELMISQTYIQVMLNNNN